MATLDETLLNTYLENLKFLELHFPDIFKKIILLNKAIEDGTYKERWSLEYIEDGSYLDIKNTETEEFLYNQNSFEFAQNIVKNTQFNDTNSFKMLTINNEDKQFNEEQQYTPLHEMINHVNTYKRDENNFTRINKFIFVGAGVGTHLTEIYTKLKPLDILIIEPDLEIFRLSLFVTNYSLFQLQDHSLLLSVSEKKIELKNTLVRYYKYHREFNFMIKYNILFDIYDDILDDIKSFLMQGVKKDDAYSYLQVLGLQRSNLYFKKGYSYINFTKTRENALLKNKHALILSGGPSLDLHIDWIRENQDKFYIIAINLMTKNYSNVIYDLILLFQQILENMYMKH